MLIDFLQQLVRLHRIHIIEAGETLRILQQVISASLVIALRADAWRLREGLSIFELVKNGARGNHKASTNDLAALPPIDMLLSHEVVATGKLTVQLLFPMLALCTLLLEKIERIPEQILLRN